MQDIVYLFETVFLNCSSWFTRLLNASGMKSMFLAFVFLVLAVRILLYPVLGSGLSIGSAGSDIVRHVKNKY